MPCRAGRDRNSTARVQSPRSGRAHEADDGLVYRSQLCRYGAQKQTLCCCLGRICHPSPAVAAREGLLLLARGMNLCRAGDMHVRPDLGVGSGCYEIARQVLRGTPKPQHDPSVFHRPRTMDQECLSYWWRFNGTVRYRPKADVASWTEITSRLIEKSLSFVCNDIHKLIKPLVTVV